MDIRVQARAHNHPLENLFKNSNGYGICEARHFDPKFAYIFLTCDGRLFEVDVSEASVGPAIRRQKGARAECDRLPMMYVRDVSTTTFCMQTLLRPPRANDTQTFTKTNEDLEKYMVIAYAAYRGGKYLPPQDTKMIGRFMCKDDGGVRLCD